MTHVIRAVYTQGSLHPLDPVDFVEGEEIQLTVLSARDVVQNALGDLLISPQMIESHDGIDEEALMREVEKAFQGQPPLSQTIIEDRQTGP